MAENFRERLRRLRREGGGDGAVEDPGARRDSDEGPARTGPGGMPAWLAARLGARSERAGQRVGQAAGAGRSDRTVRPGPSDAGGLGAAKSHGDPRDLREADGGAFLYRETLVPAEAPHGRRSPDGALAAKATDLAFLARDTRLLELDPGRALYLDIETTGLAGGAGTWPFLVALGRFEERAGARCFAVWQGFLREPGEERALLTEVAARIADAGAIVSFFGKSFDRHRLEDKMRLCGIAPPFQAALHLDLYHPFRRLYGRALPNGRLQTLERSLLGFERVDDLPGSRAPAAWFDYLAGRPHRLEQVFEHNHLDVLSLAALTAHLGLARVDPCPLDAEAPPAAACARAWGLAELHEKAREHAEAARWYTRALALATQPGEQTSLTEALARALARTQRRPRGRPR